MIELPEAHVLAQQMKEAFVGKTITQVQVLQVPHGFAFFQGDAKGYEVMLRGLTVADTAAFGGRPELRFGDELRLSFGDGVNLRYFAPGAKLPPKHQFMLGFDDDSTLICTVQMYGFFALYANEEDSRGDHYYRVGVEKPSPLSDAFDLDYFRGLRAQETKQTLSLKAFLATEQRIPGLGNGVLQDILWRAALHPKRKLNTLTQQEFESLFAAVKQTLADMTEQGGRDTEKTLFGRAGEYRTVMSRKSTICPNCCGAIARMAYLGGNVYVCENCQK